MLIVIYLVIIKDILEGCSALIIIGVTLIVCLMNIFSNFLPLLLFLKYKWVTIFKKLILQPQSVCYFQKVSIFIKMLFVFSDISTSLYFSYSFFLIWHANFFCFVSQNRLNNSGPWQASSNRKEVKGKHISSIKKQI